MIKIKTSLSNVRIEKGYTQEEIADKLNIGISTYSQYENGVRNVPAKKVIDIANILDININDFFLPTKFTVSKQLDCMEESV